MQGSSQESLDTRYGLQSSAQLILDVANAASHLELAEVLESLIGALRPTMRFDAIAVFVIEGDYARLHSLHVEGVDRMPGESVESVVARVASSANLPPKPVIKQRLAEHHVSQAASSRKPYVCPNLQVQRRFPEDEGGLDSYLQVLDAERNLFQGQLTETGLRRDVLVSIVQLYRALGGGWQ